MMFSREWPAMTMPASTLVLVLVLAVSCSSPAPVAEYDLVILNGRVLDPESELDAVRSIGIRDGRIAALETGALQGSDVIDASGLAVAPGFIDLHAHSQTDESYRYQALDGVTTALELEVGTADVELWYREREPGQRINYGASVGHIAVRMAVMNDPGTFLPTGDAAQRRATDEEAAEIIRRIEEGLQQGAVAVGMGIPYTTGADAGELLEVFRLAARHAVPIHAHIRPGMAGLAEAIGLAEETGASLHVVHINSTGHQETPQMLETIAEARARGLDITTEAYPYAAGMTEIQSALFDDWEAWADDRFGEFEWPETGERLTRQSFARYRARGGFVIRHSNTEEMVAVAVNSPLTAIASDGLMEGGKGHPRTSGTYTRVLGRYVREAGTLTLMDAVRKMSLLPARRLEKWVPAMRDKGRLQPGADADLTLFDPATVIDRSTYREPALPPEGIRHVLVNGVPVVRDGRLVEGVAPGRPVRAVLR